MSTMGLRVLLQNRRDALEVVGGDTIQMIQTAKYLRALGVKVDISLSASPDTRGYDIIHLHNITRPHWTYLQLQKAQRQGRRVVVSPIYWNERELIYHTLLHFARTDFLGLAIVSAEWLWKRTLPRLHLVPRQPRALFNHGLQREILAGSDYILPNSAAEAALIMQTFEVDPSRVSVVHTGVEVLAPQVDYDAKLEAVRDSVLMVARFDHRKNQLSFIRALKGTRIRLVFIGSPVKTSQASLRYYETCVREAGSRAIFFPAMDHERLAAAYGQCKVHAMPSLYETPGLASLEAAAHGANIVSTDRGSAQEYFGGLAWYCDPFDQASIRKAVLAAYNAPRDPALSHCVRSAFTWEKTATATLRSYTKVLSREGILSSSG